jgi:hypothetical protein
MLVVGGFDLSCACVGMDGWMDGWMIQTHQASKESLHITMTTIFIYLFIWKTTSSLKK